MTENLFDAFEPVSSKQWKQQIQYELKGADYNDNLVWESHEGIKVKPFYHNDETEIRYALKENNTPFFILQNIYVHDVALSNKRAIDTLNRGAESIRFTIEKESVILADLMQNLPLENTTYFFYLSFLSIDFVNKINDFAANNKAKFCIQLDPIGQLTKDGNWFENGERDFEKLNTISSKSSLPFITIYTKATGSGDAPGGMYKSKRSYTISNPTALTNGTRYSFFINLNSYNIAPISIGHTNSALTITATGSVGTYNSAEILSSIAIETNAFTSPGNVEFTISNIVIGDTSGEKEYGFMNA
jgi:hypothetical protein